MATTPIFNPVPAMTTYSSPENPVVIVGESFLCQYPVDLTVKGKVWTLGENDFDIVDGNGTQIFKIKSKIFSIHDRRKMLDASGNTLVTYKQKFRTLHRRWKVYRGESTAKEFLLYCVKKSSILQFGTQLHVFLARNKDEKIPDFRVKGSMNESHCTIYLGESDIVLAQMSRRKDLNTRVFGTDKLLVTTFPNVDYAFVISLVAILDEVNEDRRGDD